MKLKFTGMACQHLGRYITSFIVNIVTESLQLCLCFLVCLFGGEGGWGRVCLFFFSSIVYQLDKIHLNCSELSSGHEQTVLALAPEMPELW